MERRIKNSQTPGESVPVDALVFDDLHVAVWAALVCVGVELAECKLVEGQLDEVSVKATSSHQGQVTHRCTLGLQRPQHLQLIRLAHSAVVEAVAL